MAVVETAAFSQEAVFDAVGYAPHRGQRKVHASAARHRVVDAGRRTGKSQIGGHELTVEALYTHTVAHEWRAEGKRREFWIVGPEYSDAEKEFRVLYNDLERLEVPFDRPGTYNNPESGDMHISLWQGAFEVHAKSAKYPNTLVGEGLSGVIMAEAAKLKPNVWTKFIRPTLADFRGWSIHSSTPEGRNWFYDVWKRGQDPNDPDWASWMMPSWTNDIVFPEGELDPEILDMAADMSQERFNQEVRALFTEYVGAVFKDFDETVHVTDVEYMANRPILLATDYGWTNPFVVLAIQVDVFDNVYVLAEYRATQKDTNDIARELAANPIFRNATDLYPEPASPGDTEILRKALKVNVHTGTGGEVKHRLEAIRQALKLLPESAPIEKRAPRLLIDRRCTELIREMQDYRYPEKKSEVRGAPEQPMDVDDHGPEALGRFFAGYYGGPTNSGRQRATVRRANMSRSSR